MTSYLSKNAFHFKWKNAEVTFSRLCEAWGASNDPSADLAGGMASLMAVFGSGGWEGQKQTQIGRFPTHPPLQPKISSEDVMMILTMFKLTWLGLLARIKQYLQVETSLSKNAFHFRWKNAEVTFSRLCEAWGASNDPSAEGPPQYPCWTRLRHWRWIKTLWYMHNTDLDPNSLQTCKGYLVQDVLQPDKKKQTVVVDLYGCPLSCTLACTRMHRIRLSSSSLWPL